MAAPPEQELASLVQQEEPDAEQASQETPSEVCSRVHEAAPCCRDRVPTRALLFLQPSVTCCGGGLENPQLQAADGHDGIGVGDVWPMVSAYGAVGGGWLAVRAS